MDAIDESKDVHDSGKHVDFQGAAAKGHEADIKLKTLSDHSYEIHIGFLQISHQYEIEVTLPELPPPEGSFVDLLQSVNVRLLNATPISDGLRVSLSCHTTKEGLTRERVSLESEKTKTKVSMVILSRVLKKNQGTPSLKKGIRMVGVDPETESEMSDWTGF